jgi:hypothetical protein
MSFFLGEINDGEQDIYSKWIAASHRFVEDIPRVTSFLNDLLADEELEYYTEIAG